MWIYEKSLERPVKISRPDPAFAKLVITQYGGPDGELSASLRYLNQRYSMPTDKAKALLTDVGTEELAHMEMIAALVYKLIEGADPKDMEAAGWGGQYAQHNHGLFWTDANGVPWSAKYIACLGDPITDLAENMAAEQKARTTYEHLIDLTDDPCVKDTLRFLWQREVVHFQRFGECLNDVQEHMSKMNTWCGYEMRK
ncbi:MULTISPECIES: manganese catalase family protein [Pelosinus]|jgi:spore coat protein JC|uniref:Manganese containing catalase n=1 Tax=Pelosinus fermentans B4 TaxID=1149862 RepID=I8RDU8_9FIRM|nr:MULTISPECIES: manganese catalase family protein [Pelosinus]EIW17438.1 manganese containing catalase [Pelosinus fermentans B4]EIW23498.1 manganese containing catalase [Pelosinus fermentans A11]OAM91993.1 Catalase [Pelosinus fermentans DSM 17108]SDQ30338.1 spore coat protein JC [Pelosinus fermentans]